MKIILKAILSLCLATFLPLYGECHFELGGILVSIPDGAKTVRDCFVGAPDHSGTWRLTPFDSAMSRFRGGKTAQRSLGGNAYLSITVGENYDPYEMDRLRWLQSFKRAVQAQLTHYLQEQNRLQEERAAVIAQQRAQEEEIRQSEIADFKVKLLHQENFAHQEVAHDLYFTWSDSELENRFHARAIALKNMFQATNSVLTKKSYTVLKPVQNIITQYDKQADYTTLQGSELQHVLHQELLDLYEQSAQLPSSAAFYKE